MVLGKLRNNSDRSNGTMITGNADMEYFWACDLTSEKRTFKWSLPDDGLEDDDEDYIEHSLFIRSVCLGAGAVEKEENIVVMESVGYNGEVFKGTIANLTKGVNAMGNNMSLTVDGKIGVTFTLVEGSGPISICGNHLLDYPKDHDLDMSQTGEESRLNGTEELEDEETEGDEEEEEEDENEEEKGKAKPKATKRKAPVKSNKQKQKAKMSVDDEEEDEEDDDEENEDEDEEDLDEEDESEEDYKPKKGKKETKKAKGKAKSAPVKDLKKAGKKVKK